MTAADEAYPFVEREPGLGAAGLAPLLPLTLLGPQAVQTMGLLDTGATVKVLPYGIGEQLGLVWEGQTIPIALSGNLAACEARAVLLKAEVGRFAPVRLAFAWARTDSVPVLLGQVNFFMEFDVCFYRSRSLFEIRSRVGDQAAG
jgi:hypothetical protein